MNEYFSRLNPAERRFVVGVAVLLFVVVNIWWVWPHFSDWGIQQRRLNNARGKLASYQALIQQKPTLERELQQLGGDALAVPPEDQATKFFNTIQTEALQNGVNFIGNSRPVTRTNNQFFVEQVLTVQVQATEKQLINFLYQLGSGGSLIRVRALSVHPDPTRQQLNANIALVASYQKNVRTASAAPAKAGAVVDPARPAPAKTAPPPRPPAANPPTPKNK